MWNHVPAGAKDVPRLQPEYAHDIWAAGFGSLGPELPGDHGDPLLCSKPGGAESGGGASKALGLGPPFGSEAKREPSKSLTEPNCLELLKVTFQQKPVLPKTWQRPFWFEGPVLDLRA